MLDTIKNTVLLPLLHRVGTTAGAMLVGIGATEQSANHIVIGAIAAAGVIFDLVVAHFNWRGR